MKLRFLAASLAATSVAFAGCSSSEKSDLDGQRATNLLSSNSREVADRLAAAAGFLRDSDLVRGLLPQGDCSGPSSGPVSPPSDDEWGSPEDECELDFDPAATSRELADWLASRVFTEGNIESEQGGVVVFRLRSSVVCDRHDDDCRDLLDRVAIRLRVTSSSGDALSIAILVDGSQPFTVRLDPRSVGVVADLGAIRSTFEAITGGDSAPVRGPARFGLSSDDDSGFPDISGKVELVLTSLAADRVELRASVLEAIDVRPHDADGAELHVDRAVPAFVATLDGGSKKLDLASSLGAVDLGGPLAALVSGEGDCYYDDEGGLICEEEETTTGLSGHLGIHLAGLEGATSLDLANGAEALRLTGFGLGNASSVVRLDGAPLFRLDLNPNSGRHFDLTATSDAGGTKIEVSPGFEMQLAIQLANVADQIEVPSWALDELLTVRLDGAAAPAVRLLHGSDEAPLPPLFPDDAFVATPMLEVLAGTLTLESRSLPSVSVAAGMCLYGDSDAPSVGRDDPAAPEAAEPHPFEAFTAGVCQ
ncbi:hypothetical protein [Vulgatibacter incomptus]|nr:hypothetical protein [Vulgatibacter incomptus]